MGQSGGYKNESGSLKCPTTACQVKWAPQMSGASLCQCLRLRSPTHEASWGLTARPSGEATFCSLRVFVPWHWTPQACHVGVTPHTHALLMLCVCVCTGVCFMLVKCQQCRTHEFAPGTRTKLWKTAARPDTFYCFICMLFIRVCMLVFIYNIFWQIYMTTRKWNARLAHKETAIFQLMRLFY